MFALKGSGEQMGWWGTEQRSRGGELCETELQTEDELTMLGTKCWAPFPAEQQERKEKRPGDERKVEEKVTSLHMLL